MIDAFLDRFSFVWMGLLFLVELGIAFACAITGSLVVYATLSIIGVVVCILDPLDKVK